jgi:hypothetical protein
MAWLLFRVIARRLKARCKNNFRRQRGKKKLQRKELRALPQLHARQQQ